MSWRVAGVCSLLFVVGCGGAQRPAATRRCPVDRPAVSQDGAATTVRATTAVTSAPEPDGLVDGECDRRTLEAADPALSRQEARIEEGRAALSTAGGDCARVCAAASGICEAAGEVCRLTGDGAPRCARARAACDDATQRRTSACPVCPAP